MPWLCLMTLLVGPFGLVLGPLLARWANRRVARLYPNADMAARARSQGYQFGQVSALIFCTVYALAGLVLLVPAMLTLAMIMAG